MQSERYKHGWVVGRSANKQRFTVLDSAGKRCTVVSELIMDTTKVCSCLARNQCIHRCALSTLTLPCVRAVP